MLSLLHWTARLYYCPDVSSQTTPDQQDSLTEPTESSCMSAPHHLTSHLEHTPTHSDNYNIVGQQRHRRTTTQTTTTTTITTRNTQRAQTSAERQHNKIAKWFLQCKLAMQLWSESTKYFFDSPVNPDFGLRTPGSGRWSGLSPKFIPLVPGPCPKPPRNFVKIRSQLFSYPTDRQTNRPK